MKPIVRQCNKCGEEKSLTTENFNRLSTGYYRGTCKICMARNTKKHYDRDPTKVMERVQRYNDQKKKAGGYCSDYDKQAIRDAQFDLCYYCGDELSGLGELDHKTPVSKGGTSWPNNMAYACRTCNRDKHGKSAEDFFEWRTNLGLPINRKNSPSNI